jgi:hypothetical protein
MPKVGTGKGSKMFSDGPKGMADAKAEAKKSGKKMEMMPGHKKGGKKPGK